MTKCSKKIFVNQKIPEKITVIYNQDLIASFGTFSTALSSDNFNLFWSNKKYITFV